MALCDPTELGGRVDAQTEEPGFTIARYAQSDAPAPLERR